jgi:hypothetical protein
VKPGDKVVSHGARGVVIERQTIFPLKGFLKQSPHHFVVAFYKGAVLLTLHESALTREENQD